MKRVGFTGTQQGMTAKQRSTVKYLIAELQPVEAHHGDCTGADEEFHQLVRGFTDTVWVVLHPGCDRKGESPARAHCDGDETLPTRFYLTRNEEIVKAVGTMIATPAQATETIRSGTWTTVRRARKHNRELYVVLPDGSLL